MSDLWAALCLVAVLEGLLLFASPVAWKQAMVRMLQLSDRQVRVFGGVLLVAGAAALWWLRQG